MPGFRTTPAAPLLFLEKSRPREQAADHDPVNTPPRARPKLRPFAAAVRRLR
jgi:hypothetical protein